METIGTPVATSARSYRVAAVSAVVHLAILGVFLHRPYPRILPASNPGTADGHNLVLSYLPGRAPKPSAAPPPKATPLEIRSKIALRQPDPITPTATSPNQSSPASEHPDSSSGADALGSGNITIALVKYFPRPRPDLSNLPDGAKGDVILDVTIDETGKISDLKLVKGIEHGVDEFVVAAVRNWTFTPASRDGQPIASEQELHFHYEKG